MQPAGTGQFPPISPQELQRYQAMFVKLDLDKDGLVQVRSSAAGQK